MPAVKAFEQLENIRKRLPENKKIIKAEKFPNLSYLFSEFDYYFFDAFGVLNVGSTPIAGVKEQIAELRKLGKKVFVLSNAAAFEKSKLHERFLNFSYDFSIPEIISSRDALLRFADLKSDVIYGVIGKKEFQNDLSHLQWIHQDENNFYEKSQAFLFLSSMEWNAQKQALFVKELRKNPRPVFVGNPDLLAPQGDKSTIEAGTYTLLLPEDLYPLVKIFGKPFPEIFQVVAERIGESFKPEKALMIGDTLHTDILGAQNFGIKSVLISNHGFFKGLDCDLYIEKSQIFPDFILPSV